MHTTDRQTEVLEFIRSHVREKGYAPSLRDIGKHFGFTSVNALNHMRALERRGLIRSTPNVARSIVVL